MSAPAPPRFTLSLPPGYAPLPRRAERAALLGAATAADRASVDAALDALAARSAARGVVTTGALALDDGTTAWLTVAITPLRPPPVDAAGVRGLVDLLRARYPAADVRPVSLPAGAAARVEQRGHLDLPGRRVELADVRHLLLAGGSDVVTVVLQATGADPALLGATADRIAHGARLGDGGP